MSLLYHNKIQITNFKQAPSNCVLCNVYVYVPVTFYHNLFEC